MPKKRRSPIALSLLKNSKSAVLSAIEIHNKPVFQYRYEITILLVLNSWELLLKAYIYKYLDKRWLYEKDGKTKPFDDCLNKLVHTTGQKYLTLRENLRVLYKYRCDIAHFYIDKLDIILFGLLKQNIHFYNDFINLHFKTSLDEHDDFILLPLGFKKPYSPIDFITNRSAIHDSSKEVRDFIQTIIDSTKLLASHSIEEPIIVDFSMNLTDAKKIKNADILASVDNSIKNLPTFTVTKASSKIHYLKKDEIDQLSFTSNKNLSTGVLVHQELSETLFDEINSVIGANNLIDRNSGNFQFGESVYYKIYADREHVFSEPKNLRMLAETAVSKYYVPYLYWILKLSPAAAAKAIDNWHKNLKHPNAYGFFSLIILLGKEAIDWIVPYLDNKFAKSQAPNYYYTFKDQIKKKQNIDIRLRALRMSAITNLNLVGMDSPIALKELLKNEDLANRALTNECISVFKGNKESRPNTRYLDIIKYGIKIHEKSSRIISELYKIE